MTILDQEFTGMWDIDKGITQKSGVDTLDEELKITLEDEYSHNGSQTKRISMSSLRLFAAP